MGFQRNIFTCASFSEEKSGIFLRFFINPIREASVQAIVYARCPEDRLGENILLRYQVISCSIKGRTTAAEQRQTNKVIGRVRYKIERAFSVC